MGGMWSDYIRIINEGMDEAVYKEIAKALIQAIELFPRANKTAVSAFDEASFDRLLQTVAVYGQPVIYCTLEAAMTLMPTNDWMSDSMKEERFNIGYFARYKGCPVVILPQSFTDETNEMKIIDPSYLYIFPTNNTKPVQIVFEGQTLVKEWDTQRDWSRELHTYRKFGVGIFTTNNLAVYRNTSLQMQNVPGPWPNP